MPERPAWLDYWNLHPHDERFPEFHPGWRRSEHEHGVAFHAPWEQVFAGFPEHSRRLAVALAATGVPVHLRSIRGGSQFQTTRDHDSARAYLRMRDTLKDLLEASIKTYDADIWMTIAESAAFFRIGGPKHHWMDPDELRRVQARRIISTVFERDRISESDQACLSRVGQIWVANPADERMLREHGLATADIRVIPIPHFPGDPHLALAERPRRPGPLVFYHIGKWEPRKNQHAIIGAFLCAFEPGDDVQLFIKTSARGPQLKSAYPQSPAESVRAWVADPRTSFTLEQANRQVRVIQTRLSARQMVQLHRGGDVYVTASRGEGFDMPAYDAKLAARRMVYTPSGGPQSFAASADIRIEPTGKVEADPIYGWGPGASYLDYDFDELVAAFRRARDEGPSKAPLSAEQLRSFGADAVGELMKRAVEAVKGDDGPQA